MSGEFIETYDEKKGRVRGERLKLVARVADFARKVMNEDSKIRKRAGLSWPQLRAESERYLANFDAAKHRAVTLPVSRARTR